jgi:HEAT repeat protein
MIHLLTWVVVGLAAALGLLIVAIVVRRLDTNRRLRRERSLRPAIEVAMAGYVAGDDPEPPQFPASRAARELLRTVALEALTELRGGERQRLTTLLERASIVGDTAAELRSRRVRVRRSAAEALAQIASATAAESMLTGLLDPDLDMRLSCASGLAELGNQEYVAAILVAANGAAAERPGATAAVLLTLGRRIPSSLGSALAPTPDASPELRRLAAAVVGELRLAEHAPALRQALDSEDDELVARAARGIGQIGDADAIDRLLRLLEEPESAWFVRLAVAGALGALGDPRAARPLEHELQSGSWLLQSKAADALRLLGGSGEEVLRRALSFPVATVRDHARVALEQ